MARAFFRSFVEPGERLRAEDGFEQGDHPYNKDCSQWPARLARFLSATPLRKLALRRDDPLRPHDRVSAASWWAGARLTRQERVKAIRDDRRRAQTRDP